MKDLSKANSDIRRNVKRLPLFADEPQNLAELFRYSAEKFKLSDALNYKENGKWHSISSAEMIARAENIALGLYSLGIKRGDRVAILAANSPDWTIIDAGCQFAGVIDVPIYTTLAPNSIQYIINDSGAKAFFIEDSEMLARIAAILPECPTIEKIILFNGINISREDVIALASLEESGSALREQKPGLLGEILSGIAGDDVATLIYTSGTTGEPKGVMLSHQNILSNLIDAGEKYSFSLRDTPLSVLPLSHVFERTGMYLYIYNGMAVHYAESIDKVPENLKEVKPTIFVGVPRIFEKVYARAKEKAASGGKLKNALFDWAIRVGKEWAAKNENREEIPRFLAIKHDIADRLVFSKFRDVFGGRLRFCITGGAALSDDIYYIFNGAGVNIMQGYGLTETSPVISSNNPLYVKVGTVGKPLRNNEVRIAADGEIEASGPGIMLGYYNKPEATREAFTEDGWFKTGDIGRIDEEGFLYITDRKKELFKTSGGKYIAPSPVEQMIKASRFVNQVVLIGNGRNFPAALIVPNFEPLEGYAKYKGIAFADKSALCKEPRIIDKLQREVDSLTQGLSQYEKVKKIALIENEMTIDGGELTPTLKVKRRIVDEKYREIIDQLYSANR